MRNDGLISRFLELSSIINFLTGDLLTFLRAFCFFKLAHSLKEGVIGHMDIPIHCCFDAGMTQQLLQHLRLHTAFDCSCSIGMSQGVHTKVFDPCFIAELI